MSQSRGYTSRIKASQRRVQQLHAHPRVRMHPVLVARRLEGGKGSGRKGYEHDVSLGACERTIGVAVPYAPLLLQGVDHSSLRR